MLALDAEGREITTIEGLGQAGGLDPLQESFVSLGGLQCGFCTPGMIMTAKAILDENPRPTEAEVRTKMAGNLCRCTGYKKVVEAVMEAAESREGGE
jgi:carbon-monoxide dehydrogenase small subunit